MPAREREQGLEPRGGPGREPAPEAFREVAQRVPRPGPPDPVPALALEGVKLDDPLALAGAVRGEEGRLGELARAKAQGEFLPSPASIAPRCGSQ